MKIFLSYAQQDHERASALASQLASTGFDVWWDGQLLPGDNWAEQMGRALKASDGMVVLYSPNTAGSASVQRDIEFALGSPRYKNRVVTVVTDKSVEPPGILGRLHLVRTSRRDPALWSQQIAERLREVATA